MGKRNPTISVWRPEFLAEPRGLSLEARGLYAVMLDSLWIRAEFVVNSGGIPRELKGINPRTIRKVWPEIEELFEPVHRENGTVAGWTHPALMHQLNLSIKRSERGRVAGKASHRARHGIPADEPGGGQRKLPPKVNASSQRKLNNKSLCHSPPEGLQGEGTLLSPKFGGAA